MRGECYHRSVSTVELTSVIRHSAPTRAQRRYRALGWGRYRVVDRIGYLAVSRAWDVWHRCDVRARWPELGFPVEA